MKKNFTYRRYNMLITAGILSFANACSACNKDNNQQNNNTSKDTSVLQGENDDLKRQLNTLRQKYQRLVSQTGNKPQAHSDQSGQRMKENPTYTKLPNVAALKQALNDADKDATKLGDVSPKIIAVANDIIDSSLLGNKQTQAFLSLADELISSELFQKLSEQEIGFKADTSQKNGGEPYFGTEDYVLVKELKPETFVDCLKLYSLLATLGYQVEEILNLSIFAPKDKRDLSWVRRMLDALETVKSNQRFVRKACAIKFDEKIVFAKDGTDSGLTIADDDDTRKLIRSLEPALIFKNVFDLPAEEICLGADLSSPTSISDLTVEFFDVPVEHVDLNGKEELFKFIFGKAKAFTVDRNCCCIVSNKKKCLQKKTRTGCQFGFYTGRKAIYQEYYIRDIKAFLDFVGKDDNFEPAIAIVKLSKTFNIGDLTVPINFDDLEENGNVEFITMVLNSDLVKEGWLRVILHNFIKNRSNNNFFFNGYTLGNWKNNVDMWGKNKNKEDSQRTLCFNFLKTLAETGGLTGVKEIQSLNDKEGNKAQELKTILLDGSEKTVSLYN